MKSIEISAKTIDVAIEEALEKLKCGHDDVDIEIISSGGMFKKAKVRATLKSGVSTVAEVTPEPINENPPESFESLYFEKEKERESQKPKKEQPTPRPKPQVASDYVPPTATPEDKLPNKLKVARDFVVRFLQLIENDATVIASVDDKALKLDISGEDVGRLIGKGGVALSALQTIVTTIAIAAGENESRRVYINIENYREKRTQTLTELGLRKAEAVKKSGKTIRLDPMTPRERAIIHTALQEVDGIKTFSKGTDPNRFLVIAPIQTSGESDEN